MKRKGNAILYWKLVTFGMEQDVPVQSRIWNTNRAAGALFEYCESNFMRILKFQYIYMKELLSQNYHSNASLGSL